MSSGYQHKPPAQGTVKASPLVKCVSGFAAWDTSLKRSKPEPALQPALVAGPITGYRLWPIYADGSNYWLGSLAVDSTQWMPGFPQVASCEQRGFNLFITHDANKTPHKGCTCGVHAMRHREQLLLYLQAAPASKIGRLVGIAAGSIMLWGRVIEHQHGYRAQYGYPHTIWPYYPHLPQGFPRPKARMEPFYRVAEAYGISVQDNL